MEEPPSSQFNYSEELEPVATEEEIESYEQQVRVEQEEEEMLKDRFSGVIELRNWCSCGSCSLDLATKHEECFCCKDIDRCREKTEEFEEDLDCITDHPGFRSVCLDKWVLEAAAIGLKTRKGRSYTVLRHKGKKSEEQFFRAVAYRQFYRLISEYDGKRTRLPLPCCVYNTIRNEFPSQDGRYRGFEEEDEEAGESETDTEIEEEELQFEEENYYSA